LATSVSYCAFGIVSSQEFNSVRADSPKKMLVSFLLAFMVMGLVVILFLDEHINSSISFQLRCQMPTCLKTVHYKTGLHLNFLFWERIS
ncbi:MAG: hypothetical protein ACXWCA_06930, partial [Kaistella sp.]